MKIAGFTIIRNAIINDYPVAEAIRSILPVVDEMVVLVGESDDETEALIRSIGSGKIRIISSVWDMSMRTGGKVLAVETDKALRHVTADCDWAFYIQADEVLHERYQEAVRHSCERYLEDRNVEGLLFDYNHFYGTYDYIGDSRRWYNKEVRIIRNDPSIQAYRDAQGFRKEGRKLRVKHSGAAIYHYGWVKSPDVMKRKLNHFNRLWHDDGKVEAFIRSSDVFDFNDFDSLTAFTGSHPGVMKDRIARANWNLQLDTGIKRFSFKDRLLYWVERSTGKRLFAYKNYRKI